MVDINTRYANNVGTTTTDSPLLSTANIINVVYDGKFPAIVDTQYFYMTLQDAGGLIDPEVVKITAHTPGSNSITVVRGQDGTVAKEWALGTTIGMRDNAAVFEELRTGILAVDAKIGAPVSVIWREIPVQNWTVGEVVSFQLSDYAISPDGSPISYQTTSGALPDSLTLDEDTGEILGTIFPVQGGTYETAIAATNASGIPITMVLPALIVSLGVTAPILDTIADVAYEVGTLIDPINLNDSLLDDGNPSGIESITWTLDGYPNVALPLDVSLDSVTGIISGAVGLSVTPDALSIGVIASNSSLPSDVQTFTFTVQAATVFESPVVGRWDSGEAVCAVANVVPTWGTSTNFFVNEFQTITTGLQMLNYIASIGTAAVTDIELTAASPLLPSTLTLDTDGTGGAGIGFITGVVADGQAVAYGAEDLVFRASNDGGSSWSDDSDPFTMTVQDPAIVVPTITSIQ